MKLHVTIAGYQTEVQLRDSGDSLDAEIDGRLYELVVRETGAGGFLLIYDDLVFDCQIEGRPASGKAVDVVVGTTQYRVAVTDPKRFRGASTAGALGDGAARITAAMPGKVVRVLVNLGNQVEIGAGIVVVEAMKMQNELKSPKAGTVVALNVQTGATVNGGDVLAVIE